MTLSAINSSMLPVGHSQPPPDIIAKDKFDRLRDLIQSKQCVAWIGSGLSRPVYKEWTTIVKELWRTCTGKTPRWNPRRGLTSDFLFKKADECKTKSEIKYNTFLNQYFMRECRNTGYESPSYRQLIRLPFHSYATTNFDPLLYEAGKHENGNANIPDKNVVSYPHLLKGSPSLDQSRRIYYMHGRADRGRSIDEHRFVFSSSEMAEAWGRTGDAINLAHRLYETMPLLFLGCTLSERQIRTAFREIKEQVAKKAEKLPPHLALVRKKGGANIDNSTEQAWNELGVEVIWYKEEKEEFANLLKILEFCGPTLSELGEGDLLGGATPPL